MKEIIEQLLPLWGIESGHVSQIYSSAWEIDHSCVVKIYHDQQQLERNIRLLSILQHCDIPVAEILCTKAGETYVTHQNAFFLLSKKLPGSSVTDLKDKTMAWKMGCAIARLHTAFLRCEQ